MSEILLLSPPCHYHHYTPPLPSSSTPVNTHIWANPGRACQHPHDPRAPCHRLQPAAVAATTTTPSRLPPPPHHRPSRPPAPPESPPCHPTTTTAHLPMSPPTSRPPRHHQPTTTTTTTTKTTPSATSLPIEPAKGRQRKSGTGWRQGRRGRGTTMTLVVVPRSSLIMGEGGVQGDNDGCVVVLHSVR